MRKTQGFSIGVVARARGGVIHAFRIGWVRSCFVELRGARALATEVRSGVESREVGDCLRRRGARRAKSGDRH